MKVIDCARMPFLLRAGLLVVSVMNLTSIAYADSVKESLRQTMPLTVERTAGNEEPGVVLDAISHTSIEIERPPAVVWPHILDSNSWTGLNLIRREGPPGQVGEIFTLIDPKNPDRIRTVFAKTLELVPEQRRTFKTYDRTGRRGAYVTWMLQKIGRRTLVSYDIYYQEFLPRDKTRPTGGDPSDAQLQARRDALRKGSEAELQQLKKFVEARRQ